MWVESCRAGSCDGERINVVREVKACADRALSARSPPQQPRAMRFHCFFFRLPDLITLKTSSSETAATFGMGTDHLPAFSFRFCLIELERTLACDIPSRSSRYEGTASLSAGASPDLCLARAGASNVM